MANQASKPDHGAKREPAPKLPDHQAVEAAGPDLPPVPEPQPVSEPQSVPEPPPVPQPQSVEDAGPVRAGPDAVSDPAEPPMASAGPDLPPVPDLSERERHEQRMLDYIESGYTAYDARRKAIAEISRERRGGRDRRQKTHQTPQTRQQQEDAGPDSRDAEPDSRVDDPPREEQETEPDTPPVPKRGGRDRRNLQTIGIKRKPSRRNKGGGIKLGLIQYSEEHHENQQRSRGRRSGRADRRRTGSEPGDGETIKALMDGQAEMHRLLLEILEALRW